MAKALGSPQTVGSRARLLKVVDCFPGSWTVDGSCPLDSSPSAVLRLSASFKVLKVPLLLA